MHADLLEDGRIDPLSRMFRNITIFVLLVLLAFSIFGLDLGKPAEVKSYSYAEFEEILQAGSVKNAAVVTDGDRYMVSGELNDGTKYSTTLPADATYVQSMQEAGVDVSFDKVADTSWWVNMLTTLLPMLIIFSLLMMFLQQSQGGGKMMQFSKSRAKLHTDDRKRVTFADVAGVDEVVEELSEVVDFLKNPRKFSQLGARIPKGVLLFGPPGTGKTLLAKAVAGEAGVPFFSISGSDFVEMFVGVGASRVRDLFEQAKRQSPCIVFIDEIDAVGRQRGAGLGGGHDEREQTLNQLLVEMDGFNVNEGIIVIAATNRPDILDPALLRPGRFDRQVTVGYPDIVGREQILKVHAANKPLDTDVDLSILARRTPGFTGADLANMVNEAALLAARQNRQTVSMKNMEDAIERVIAGPEKKSKVISESEKRLVSYHEAGHAIVAYHTPTADPLHKVSIVPRGRAGGYTLLLPTEDRNYMTRSKMTGEIAIFMGGRVAEALVLGDISTGASNDLERATDLVREMVTLYGMSDKLGPVVLGRRSEEVFLGRDISQNRNYSEAVAFNVDKEIHRMLHEAYDQAKNILETDMEKLHLVAVALMDHETILA